MPGPAPHVARVRVRSLGLRGRLAALMTGSGDNDAGAGGDMTLSVGSFGLDSSGASLNEQDAYKLGSRFRIR
jgi:hypothetical protein